MTGDGTAGLWGTIGPLVAWILVTSLAAIGGAVTAQAAGSFYAQLERPRWAPPAWLFGPAWTVLYISIGTAAWLVWRRHGLAGAPGAFAVYGVQLLLNAAWSWFFFVRRSGAQAFAEVALLWLSVAAMLVAFGRLEPLAGWLLVPYLAWVSFAAALTWSVWRRNPTLL